MNRQRTRGLTLVELMIALAIISLLAGIALPAVKELIQDQKISRAASSVQAIIQEAQARSIARGGGGGILIERIGDLSIYERCQSVRVRLVDVPPEYAGDPGVPDPFLGVSDVNEVTLWFHPAAAQIERSVRDIKNFRDANPGVEIPQDLTLINRGNTVQIDGFGAPQTIQDIFPGTAAARGTANLTNQEIPTEDASSWYRIVLTPNADGARLASFVRKRVGVSITRTPRDSITPPLDLPNGSAIDLTASGVGRFGSQFSPMFVRTNYMDDMLPPFTSGVDNYGSILILFGPRGEVSRVLSGTIPIGSTVVTLTDIPVTGDIFLLVSDSGDFKPFPEEQLEDQDTDPLNDEAQDGTTPLLNGDSVWVTIRARSGEVLTSNWIDPTSESVNLIPPPFGSPDTDLQRQTRIGKVLGLTRTAAAESFDIGSR